ncbi:hypothetical protein LSAT2_015479 [Lamellibrachia satsuma]|nr:hypothetical protein LSAT2_015479 [Lamellibrachia satsuma]
MKIVQAVAILCVTMTSFSLPTGTGIHPSWISVRRLLRTRRTTNDVLAMSRDTQHRIEETASAYCQLVYTTLGTSPSGADGPLHVCRKVAKDVLPMLSLPPLEVFATSKRVTKTALVSALLTAKRLDETLARLAEVGTASLLRRRHGGMAACVALTDGRDPCLIICDKGKKPERQLYCNLREKVLPRLRNLVQLLYAKIPKDGEHKSYSKDRGIDATSSHIALRLYGVAVLEYSQRQMALTSELFRSLG